MVRNLAGLAAGLAVALIAIVLVEAVGHQLFPAPPGYDMSQSSSLALPVETLIWPVIGWLLGALAGSWVALRISGTPWTGWAIAGLVLAATVLNFALIAHPAWMMVAGALGPVLGGWIAQRLPTGNPPAR